MYNSEQNFVKLILKELMSTYFKIWLKDYLWWEDKNLLIPRICTMQLIFKILFHICCCFLITEQLSKFLSLKRRCLGILTGHLLTEMIQLLLLFRICHIKNMPLFHLPCSKLHSEWLAWQNYQEKASPKSHKQIQRF